MLFLLFYIVVIISGIVSLYYYCKLFKYLNQSVSSQYSKEVRGFFVYPLILFISWMPAIFDLVYSDVLGNFSFTVRIIHVVASHLQGFMNALAYGIIERFKIFITRRSDSDGAEMEKPYMSVDDRDSIGSKKDFDSLTKALYE